MKVVLQRTSSASVSVDGKVCGGIDKGILVLLGISNEDIGKEEKIDKMLDKIVKLRIFEDEDSKLNRSLRDVDGELLIISNFTLYGDARKGNRPSYTDAARPELANDVYNQFVERANKLNLKKVATGIFGADMNVNIVNDGPVTIIYEL